MEKMSVKTALKNVIGNNMCEGCHKSAKGRMNDEVCKECITRFDNSAEAVMGFVKSHWEELGIAFHKIAPKAGSGRKF